MPENLKPELLPCPNPWCLSISAELYCAEPAGMQVRCRACGLNGPGPFERSKDAVVAWNTNFVLGARKTLPVEAAGPMTTEYLKANRDLPMALRFVRQYSDEVWRLCQLGHLNSRSKLADITLDARAFLDDLSDKLEVPAPPADTAHAAVTKVTEWDGAYFCGACNELLVLDQQPYCHKCGTQLACDHGIGHTDYCAPCGRTVSE